MSGRRMPVRIQEIPLTGEWVDWKITAQLNPPLRVYEDLVSGKLERIAPALSLVLKAWNFVDAEGNDLPSPTEQVIRDHLPLDLVTEIATQYSEAQTKLPKA